MARGELPAFHQRFVAGGFVGRQHFDELVECGQDPALLGPDAGVVVLPLGRHRAKKLLDVPPPCGRVTGHPAVERDDQRAVAQGGEHRERDPRAGSRDRHGPFDGREGFLLLVGQDPPVSFGKAGTVEAEKLHLTEAEMP